MHEDLQRSKKQYPMIEELIVRGKPLTGSRFKQINGNHLHLQILLLHGNSPLWCSNTISIDEVYTGSGGKFCQHGG